MRTIIVVGGGIAGTSCVESLVQSYDPRSPKYSAIILITESKLVKKVVDYKLSGRNLEQFKVIEGDLSEDLGFELPEGLSFRTVLGTVISIDPTEKNLVVQINSIDKSMVFDMLCLCNGSQPRNIRLSGGIHDLEINSRLIVIRDTTSVQNLKKKLENCYRLVIVGNGGISLELIKEISNCQKIWLVRDESVGFPFLDSGAAKFLLDSMDREKAKSESKTFKHSCETRSYTCSVSNSSKPSEFGPSLGPYWLTETQLKGTCDSNDLEIIYQDEIEEILFNESRKHVLEIITKNKRKVHCDIVVVAIGVLPNKIEVIGENLDHESDGGILIDEQMRTSLPCIYAAGDVVSCERWTKKELWFQMRLWTQARQMGFYAGRCIAAHSAGEDPTIYFNFDCFTHCTNFFDYRLVLLGLYNGQFLNQSEASKYEVIARVNPLKDYVKLLLKDGKIIGSVMLGDSGLEETIENLIHDQIDVSRYKDQLLDGTVDIEDYFD